jgi:hypothetical protein
MMCGMMCCARQSSANLETRMPQQWHPLSGAQTRGVELLMRVQMGSLCVHERPVVMEAAEQILAQRVLLVVRMSSLCPILMFDCPATSAQRDTMLDEIRSVLRQVAGGAEKLRNVLALSDASTKLLRFISDDVWGSKGVCRVISKSISSYLVQAWDNNNQSL